MFVYTKRQIALAYDFAWGAIEYFPLWFFLFGVVYEYVINIRARHQYIGGYGILQGATKQTKKIDEAL